MINIWTWCDCTAGQTDGQTYGLNGQDDSYTPPKFVCGGIIIYWEFKFMEEGYSWNPQNPASITSNDSNINVVLFLYLTSFYKYM